MTFKNCLNIKIIEEYIHKINNILFIPKRVKLFLSNPQILSICSLFVHDLVYLSNHHFEQIFSSTRCWVEYRLFLPKTIRALSHINFYFIH